MLATAECLAPEPLTNAAAAPSMHIELLHNNGTPVASPPATLASDFTLPVSMEQKFRHRKGPDIIDRLINGVLEIRLCNNQTKAVVAMTVIDMLPFGLGSAEICNSSLSLTPVATDDAFKVSQVNCTAV